MRPLPALLALVILLMPLGAAASVSAQTGPSDAPPEPPEPPEAAAEVRVWQRLSDPGPIHVSARRAGGRWSDAGTVPLPLDDGHSASGTYRYGDLAIAGVELRIWQHTAQERTLWISARLEGARPGPGSGPCRSRSTADTAPTGATATTTSPSPSRCPRPAASRTRRRR